MRRFFSMFSLTTGFLGSFLVSRPSQAHPTITVGAVVPANAQIPVDKIDHSAWDALLKKYVDIRGLVDYKSWKASAADTKALDAYLTYLSAASFSGNPAKESQLAFWINAYNAVTVHGILREYPTTSIRNHTAKIHGYNIWKDLQLPVAGQKYSLKAMERQVLRKLGEPRIHFAIVCASLGCPRLLNEAYTAKSLDEQLSTNSKAFFADPTKFAIDATTGKIHVSPILKWFAEDFGTDTAAQLKTIAPYLPDNARQLVFGGRACVSYLEYDWGINDRVIPR